jgi:hypothetical protein
MIDDRLPAALLFALTASVSLAAERSVDKRLDAPASGRFVLVSDTGSVAIVGSDAHEIVVHVQIEGPTAFVDHFSISTTQDSSGVTVTGRAGGWRDWLFASTRVEYTIRVPREYPIEIATAGGPLDVRNLNAAVQAMTSGGGIVVRDVTGSVNVRTSGGGIHAAGLKGPTELRTSGGSIHVSDCAGDLDVYTSGGGIRLDHIDGRVTARTSGGGIYATVLSNHGVWLTTSGGGITLLLPQDVHASIEASTSGGGVGSELPLSSAETFKRTRIRGSINGGGDPVELHTSGGGIHVGPLNPSKQNAAAT